MRKGINRAILNIDEGKSFKKKVILVIILNEMTNIALYLKIKVTMSLFRKSSKNTIIYLNNQRYIGSKK